MPYTLNWLIENEIIYIRYSGTTTAQEMRDCMLKARDWIESSPHPLVHVINDVGDVTESLPLKESIQVVREVGVPKQAGWNLTVREKSAFIKMGAAMGASIFKMRYRSFGTIEEALAHLKLVDVTLGWDKIDQTVLELTKV